MQRLHYNCCIITANESVYKCTIQIKTGNLSDISLSPVFGGANLLSSILLIKPCHQRKTGNISDISILSVLRGTVELSKSLLKLLLYSIVRVYVTTQV